MDITPAQLKEWIDIIWSLSIKGLVVFIIVYYRDLVTKVIGTFIEIVASWLKKS